MFVSYREGNYDLWYIDVSSLNTVGSAGVGVGAGGGPKPGK